MHSIRSFPQEQAGRHMIYSPFPNPHSPNCKTPSAKSTFKYKLTFSRQIL